MRISNKGLDLIKSFEGWYSAPYLDPIGIPTIGYSPCEEEFAHTPKDRISIDLMEKSVYGYISISIALTRKE